MFRGKRPKIQIVDEKFRPSPKHKPMNNLLPCPRPLKGRARALWFQVIRYAPINYMMIPMAEMWCFLMVEAEEKQGRIGAARIGHLRSLTKELGLLGRGHRIVVDPKNKYFSDDFDDPGAA